MKILILTDVPPCKNFTAGIFLDQLISFLPAENVACFSVLNPALDPIYPDYVAKIDFQKTIKPREDWGASVGKLGTFRSLVMETLVSWRDIPRLESEIEQFGLKVNADLLWCILQGQTMIRLAQPVARRLKLPLLTSLWDPPGWWMRANKVNSTISQQVLKEFGDALRASSATGTASWAMAKEYETVYGAKTVPLLPSLPTELALPPAERVSSNSEFTIGMAGQMYAQKEWDALIEALTEVDWQIAGRKVRIRLLGRWFGLGAKGKMNVEFLGWHSQEETIRLLSEVDVLYCPYWFESEFREEARLSFPSKLTTYLAVGRPVLFHGPEYASPAVFLAEHSAAEGCHTLDTDAIVASLTKLAEDEAFYKETSKNGSRAFMKCLSMPALQKNFMDLLDLAAA